MLWLIILYAVLASGSGVFLALSLARTFRSPVEPPDELRQAEIISILVPIKGADRRTPGILQRLVSSGLPGKVEFVFGIESADDPAFPICQQLQEDNADRDIRVVLSGEPRGLIGKQHNLLRAFEESQGEIIVCMDADIEVDPGTIQEGIPYLNDEGVGSAFFLPVYHGEAPVGGRLVEIYLNYHYNLYMGSLATVTEAPYIFGGLWMTKRSSLERTGGFESFGKTVSDDAAIGRAFLEAGLKNGLIPRTVRMEAEQLGALAGFAHLGKWLGMLRAEGTGPFFAIWIWWHPAFWSTVLLVLGLSMGWLDTASGLKVGVGIGICLLAKAATGMILNRGVFRKATLRSVLFMLGYEVLAVPVVFGLGLFRRKVTWKGREYRLGPKGVVLGLDDSG